MNKHFTILIIIILSLFSINCDNRLNNCALSVNHNNDSVILHNNVDLLNFLPIKNVCGIFYINIINIVILLLLFFIPIFFVIYSFKGEEKKPSDDDDFYE